MRVSTVEIRQQQAEWQCAEGHTPQSFGARLHRRCRAVFDILKVLRIFDAYRFARSSFTAPPSALAGDAYAR